jgi:hypothetical protein
LSFIIIHWFISHWLAEILYWLHIFSLPLAVHWQLIRYWPLHYIIIAIINIRLYYIARLLTLVISHYYCFASLLIHTFSLPLIATYSWYYWLMLMPLLPLLFHLRFHCHWLFSLAAIAIDAITPLLNDIFAISLLMLAIAPLLRHYFQLLYYYWHYYYYIHCYYAIAYWFQYFRLLILIFILLADTYASLLLYFHYWRPLRQTWYHITPLRHYWYYCQLFRYLFRHIISCHINIYYYYWYYYCHYWYCHWYYWYAISLRHYWLLMLILIYLFIDWLLPWYYWYWYIIIIFDID